MKQTLNKNIRFKISITIKRKIPGGAKPGGPLKCGRCCIPGGGPIPILGRGGNDIFTMNY